MKIKRIDILHLRIIGGLFQRLAEFLHPEMMFAQRTVCLLRRTDGKARDKKFAFQFVALRAVSEAVCEYRVKPLL